MAKGHRQDCPKLRGALRDYVTNDTWNQDFSTPLWPIPKADPKGENNHKPSVEMIDALSCHDEPQT
ncbi:hypothetical protein [Streptomyces sp. NPDC015125]|uniref:hypothetical protein n=1 Tax=Streptomyces sp. NPDC015125 TaxID=3364938 RepID=UPI003700DDE2